MQHQRRLLLNTTVRCRKEEERKEAKRRYITKWVCIAVLACIILGSGTATGIKLNSIYKDYIEVDNDKISQIEFDFYYGIAKTNSLNTTLYGSMTYGDYYSSLKVSTYHNIHYDDQPMIS